MSTVVTYGPIGLSIVRTHSYSREPIYDGPLYTFTRHRLHFRAVYNPLATSYQLPGGFAQPQATGATVATTTDAAIRHWLAQPRQQLTVTVGGFPYIICPRAGSRVDATTGPMPLMNPVVTVKGSKSYEVDWAVQCDVNECYLFDGKAPKALLSHLWKMEHHVDECFFTNRIIHGRAVFNRERLDLIGPANTDDFRSYLFHPIPPGFKRERIDVVASEDNTRLEYTILDRETAITIDPSWQAAGVVKADGTHGRLLSKLALFDKEMTVGRLTLGVLGANIADVQSGNALTRARGATGLGLMLAGGAVRGAAGMLAAGLAFQGITTGGELAIPPHVDHTINLRVWGQKRAFRATLENFGIRLIQQRCADTNIQTDGLGGILQGLESSVQHDLLGEYVELSCTFKTGPLVNALDGNFATFSRLNGPDNVTGFLTAGLADLNPPPPGDGGTRGTYLGAMVAQSLQAPCQLSTTPQDPPQVTIRTPP